MLQSSSLNFTVFQKHIFGVDRSCWDALNTRIGTPTGGSELMVLAIILILIGFIQILAKLISTFYDSICRCAKRVKKGIEKALLKKKSSNKIPSPIKEGGIAQLK